MLAGLERRVVHAPAGGDIEGPLVRLVARIHDAYVSAHVLAPAQPADGSA